MKKNDKKIEEQLSQDLEQYYNDIEIPELSIEKEEELRNLVKQNKSKRNTITLWKRITAFASVMCLIALIIIPTVIILNKNNNPQDPPTKPPTYYGKGEATKVQHTLEETQNIVNTQFPKYNFMFNDLTYITSTGFYHPKNNSLLALKISFSEKEIPYTAVEINIIASDQFVFDDQEIYTKDAQLTQNENYTMYEKSNEFPNEFHRGYIKFQNHEIYIYLARINEDLFNKFI